MLLFAVGGVTTTALAEDALIIRDKEEHILYILWVKSTVNV